MKLAKLSFVLMFAALIHTPASFAQKSLNEGGGNTAGGITVADIASNVTTPRLSVQFGYNRNTGAAWLDAELGEDYVDGYIYKGSLAVDGLSFANNHILLNQTIDCGEVKKALGIEYVKTTHQCEPKLRKITKQDGSVDGAEHPYVQIYLNVGNT